MFKSEVANEWTVFVESDDETKLYETGVKSRRAKLGSVGLVSS
jgi:hypothetical protein